jgi:predicted  nucleic acid-binding Zn-ribbon protein
MSKYYNDSDDNEQENINQETAENAEEIEQYFPFYDEENGEYKYIPAGGEDYAEEQSLQYGNTEAGDFNTSQILNKIELLNSELSRANKNKEEEKISRLSNEISSLKEQLFKIKTINELKSQFENFKKEFIKSYGQYKEDNDEKFADKGYRAFSYKDKSAKVGDFAYGYAGKAEDGGGVDIEEIASKVKEELYRRQEYDNSKILKEIEKISSQNISEQDLVEKINRVVDSKLNESCEYIITKLSQKLTSGIYNEKIDDVREKINALENKLCDLEESVKDSAEEYGERLSEVIVKFTETAAKLESRNVIDKENLYYETMLDSIGDIKTEISKSAKDIAKLNEEIQAVKEAGLLQGKEISDLKENAGRIFAESTDYQLKLINSNIMNIEENLKSYSETANQISEEIKQELGYEIENKPGKDAFEQLKAEIIAEISSSNQKSTAEILQKTEGQNELTLKIDESVSQVLQSLKDVAAIKEDFGAMLGQLLEKINSGLAQISEELSKKIQSGQEQMLTIIQKEIENIGENTNNELKDILEDQKDAVKDFIKASEINMGTVEGLGISIDTLLRQAEENVSVQSGINMSIEAINANLSGISDKAEELLSSYGETLEEIKQALSAAQKEKFEEISRLLGSSENKKGLAAEIKALSEKIEALKKMVILMRTANTGYDLSSIFAEIRKIGEKVNAQSGIDNIKQAQAVAKLKSELKEIKEKSENTEENNKEE